MHISNLVYQLPSEMLCAAERPWPSAPVYIPETALCHSFRLVTKDKTNLGMPYSPLGLPLLSYLRKGKMNSHCRQLHLPSSPLQSQSTQQLQQIRKGRALWKLVREDEGSRKEWREWLPHAEQEKEHTPAQHELSAEASNKGNNQLFLKLLTFLK